MSPKQAVKISNILGVMAILLLVYWVFTFITIEVFDLKVFRRGVTGIFMVSVLGILAVIFGALVINIMFNLTRIAQKHSLDEQHNDRINKKTLAALALLFPLILALLFGGHYHTMSKKKQLFMAAAQSIVTMNKEQNNELLNYSFSKGYINRASDILSMYRKTDNDFSYVTIIHADKMFGSSTVYLSFSPFSHDKSSEPNKVDFIRSTSGEEREYLNKVFNDGYDKVRYSSYGGKVELFYPYSHNGKTMVLYFNDYQRYGK